LYLTSTPGGDHSTAQFEVEVITHAPSYMRDWIATLPQQTFTAADGLQWTIAEERSANPPMILFVPSDFRDLTDATIDFKALLTAAKAEGMISGNEYFDGLGFGNEPREGSGSMIINSFSVNYDGDTHSASGTGGTQVASGPTVTSAPAITDPAAAQNPPPATSLASVTNASPVTNSPLATATGHNGEASFTFERAIDNLMSLAHQQTHTFEHMWS